MDLEDLKTYIRGAIELNDDDWHPNKQQWDKIVAMIMKLESKPIIPPPPMPPNTLEKEY